MMSIKPIQILLSIQHTLQKANIDYEAIINSFKQLSASENRENGKIFSNSEHFRGIVLAMLSAIKPWGVIANNLDHIDALFFQYDIAQIRDTDPLIFSQRLFDLKCGSILTKKQMQSLSHNISILMLILEEYNSLDDFITSDTPINIVNKLSKKGKYKLDQIGPPLAYEYLRNLGIKTIKPDRHIKRFTSIERMDIIHKQDKAMMDEEVVDALMSIAEQIPCNPIYLDNLIWLLCAKDYGNVCSAKPRCDLCELSLYCNYPKR